MFLALKEMKHSKLRFSLIIVMIVLISYLIFVLTALAYGLAESNRQAIDSWQAQSIALNADADGGLTQSSLSPAQTSALVSEGSAARIGQLAATVAKDSGQDKTTVQILGIRTDEFIYRQLRIADGRKDFDEHNVIADSGLRNVGYRLGDTITVGSSNAKFTIVGFTDGAKLSVAPVIYMPLGAWSQLKFGSGSNGFTGASPAEVPAASAVVFNNAQHSTTPDGVERLTIGDFIQELPGYRAQNLTFQFMLVFLFIITLVIVAVFLYILTMQKIPNFAVLKMQGILTRYLIRNTIAQALLITLIGVAIGAILTALTAIFIPPSVPMSFNVPLLAAAGGLLLIMSAIGSLASVHTIARIDPIAIMEGN